MNGSLNLTIQLRKRQNLRSKKSDLNELGKIYYLAQYKAFHRDCVKIDVESLPAGIEFHPSTDQDLLLVADDRGSVSIINAETTGQTAQIVQHQWRAHRTAIFDICWTKNGEGILIASADHSISLWKNQKLVSSFQSSENSGSVRCLAPNPENVNSKYRYRPLSLFKDRLTNIVCQK